MNTIREKKGFTIAELLVVVTIIGILVAVSIPIFTSQLDKAKIATNRANIRAAKAAAAADYLSYGNDKYCVYVYLINSGTLSDVSGITGSRLGKVDKNHPVCESIANLSYAKQRVNNMFGRIPGNLKIDKESNGIYQFIIVIVGPDGVVTRPFYDSATK